MFPFDRLSASGAASARFRRGKCALPARQSARFRRGKCARRGAIGPGLLTSLHTRPPARRGHRPIGDMSAHIQTKATVSQVLELDTLLAPDRVNGPHGRPPRLGIPLLEFVDGALGQAHAKSELALNSNPGPHAPPRSSRQMPRRTELGSFCQNADYVRFFSYLAFFPMTAHSLPSIAKVIGFHELISRSLMDFVEYASGLTLGTPLGLCLTRT